MKKKLTLWAAVALALLSSCNKYETYGEKKDKERDAIQRLLADSAFTVISQAQFEAQGNTTDVSKKEFVYMNNTGVYMQIMRPGCGEPIQEGKNTLLLRFLEISIMENTYINNDTSPYVVDKMYVTKTGTTLDATFSTGLLYSRYGANVPPGLLVPLNYIKVGRPQAPDEEIAKVRLIVPHTQGHTLATQNVYPYFYEVTFQRER